jgi:membrane protein DedA with SNARE-associated domain
LRFFLVSYLTYKFGEKIGPLLDKEGTKWSIIIAGIIIILIGVFYFLYQK